MAVMERWAELLSEQVVAICEKDSIITEVECEPLVRCWIQKLPLEERPSPVMVL